MLKRSSVVAPVVVPVLIAAAVALAGCPKQSGPGQVGGNLPRAVRLDRETEQEIARLRADHIVA